MKKILCALIALTMLCSATLLPISAAAPKYGSMLLLGDSITYGYGLDGDVNTCLSYGNLLRDELGLDSAHFTNAAVNGDTSSDLRALLPSLQAKVQSAELIIVTIGGNDLLHLLWNAVNEVLDGNFKDYSQLTEVVSNPEKLQKLTEQLTMDKITATITGYAVNMAAIAGFLRANAPEAEIIFLAQYDPLEGVEGIEALSGVSKLAITMLNEAMRQQAAGLLDCTYLDAYTLFGGHAAEWTNILAMDIHPNKEGHRQLYLLISEYLHGLATEEGTTAPAETSTDPTTPVTTVLDTEPPVTSDVVTTTDAQPSGVTEPATADDGGCGSLVALGLLACMLPAAVVVSRKREG